MTPRDVPPDDAVLLDAIEAMRGRMDIERLLAALPRLLELARDGAIVREWLRNPDGGYDGADVYNDLWGKINARHDEGEANGSTAQS